MKIDICEMTLDDLEIIKGILISDFDNFWSYEILKEELNSDTSHFFIVKDDKERIVGFAGIKVIIDEADIMNIVVHKTLRHKGIGSMLLNTLISYCKINKLKSLTLEVNENNSNAILLYEKFNFDNIGIRKNYYNGKDNAIIMRKNL